MTFGQSTIKLRLSLSLVHSMPWQRIRKNTNEICVRAFKQHEFNGINRNISKQAGDKLCQTILADRSNAQAEENVWFSISH